MKLVKNNPSIVRVATILGFAIIIIRLFFIGFFSIPTPSMEGTLQIGDKIMVNKLAYGLRTIQTPLQIPFTHQKYSSALSFPYYRLPGFGSVERNDIVVFNWPVEIQHPIDMKTFYVKRCVGLPGDSLSIINREIYINNRLAPQPDNLQFKYIVYTEEYIPERVFEKFGIYNEGDYKHQLMAVTENKRGYVIDMNAKVAKEFEKVPGINAVELLDMSNPRFSTVLFPQSPESISWTVDNYGPLWIPKKGSTILIDSNTVFSYGPTIVNYEGLENAEVTDEGKLSIDNEEIKEYTFRQNYYFMMGDNRHNSADSRYWGFVPEDHLLGPAVPIQF